MELWKQYKHKKDVLIKGYLKINPIELKFIFFYPKALNFCYEVENKIKTEM